MFRCGSFSWGFFLFGLGSQLQIIASLSFTELFVLAAMPCVILSELPYMRRNGVMPCFVLSLLMLLGCIVASLVNHTPRVFVLRGMAVCCIVPSVIVVGHWMLRRNMNGFKWMFLGTALSGILCLFVFRRAVDVSMLAGGVEDSQTTALIMSGPLFWITRVSSWLLLPIRGWYLQCPILYSALTPVGLAAFSMLTSVSGRSAALAAMGSTFFVFVGGKKQKSMRKIGKYFWTVALAGIFGGILFKNVYGYSASHGWLGEEARAKYERQTLGGTGIFKLLLGGRMESFGGIFACLDNPIIGFGPWARDFKGYNEEFLRRFGTYEDYESMLQKKRFRASKGGVGMIAGHSMIMQSWIWYGIGGLLFMLYLPFVALRYIKQDCWAVPQWFFWLAAGIPSLLWNVVFSPLCDRVMIFMTLVAFLLCRAVRKGRQRLPIEMLVEIKRAER